MSKSSAFKKKINLFPSLPGVYLMKKKEGQIIYVGKAKSLKNRVRSYFVKSSSGLKTDFLIRQIDDIDYIVTSNEIEAFLLEASLIKKHKPRYNVRLKDDKSYPYIRLSIQNDFPRFYFERRVKEDKSIYFGPYTEGAYVRALLDFLNQKFYLRDCSDSDFRNRKRPCLSWDIGICSAPCVAKIDKKTYQANCKKALNFLKGRSGSLTEKIQSQIQAYSSKLRFEEAARLRNHLKAIEMLEQNQFVVQNDKKDQDVIVMKEDEIKLFVEILHFRKGRLIGNRFHFLKKELATEEVLLSFLNQYYLENLIPDELLVQLPLKISQLKILEKVLKSRKNSPCRIFLAVSKEDKQLIQMAEKNADNHFHQEMEKDKGTEVLLSEIQKRFHIKKLPVYMECYDISHWQGQNSVGSQVVFQEAQPVKQKYRTYNLKSTDEGDDYMGLQELVRRRLKHKEEEFPDLILIDGGRGQLRAVQKILRDLKISGIALVALAKDRVKDKKSYSPEVSSSGERFYLPNRKNPVLFPKNSKALSLLLQMRDEAHRFAIKSHRKKRDKMFLKS